MFLLYYRFAYFTSVLQFVFSLKNTLESSLGKNFKTKGQRRIVSYEESVWVCFALQWHLRVLISVTQDTRCCGVGETAVMPKPLTASLDRLQMETSGVAMETMRDVFFFLNNAHELEHNDWCPFPLSICDKSSLSWFLASLKLWGKEHHAKLLLPQWPFLFPFLYGFISKSFDRINCLSQSRFSWECLL